MRIPLVVVDDREEDRYLLKRRLSSCDDFEQLIEVSSGVHFLNTFFGKNGDSVSVNDQELSFIKTLSPDLPVLVLMDINMPGLNGFETIREAQRLLAEGRGNRSLVFLIFSSSDNPLDKDEAGNFETIKGYITKPLSDESIGLIRQVYLEQVT